MSAIHQAHQTIDVDVKWLSADDEMPNLLLLFLYKYIEISQYGGSFDHNLDRFNFYSRINFIRNSLREDDCVKYTDSFSKHMWAINEDNEDI